MEVDLNRYFQAIIDTFNNTVEDFKIVFNSGHGTEIIYTAVVRWVFIVLAFLIVYKCLRSLIRGKTSSEVWAYFHIDTLSREGGTNIPITHWENVIGRHRSSDLQIDDKLISRTHGILSREDDGAWSYVDMGSKNGAIVNGKQLEPGSKATIRPGDSLILGMTNCSIYPISLEEHNNNINMRKTDTWFSSPWILLILLSTFQLLTMMQLKIALGEEYLQNITVAFLGLMGIMWAYVIVLKSFNRKAFEMEFLAFFLSTLSFAVTATKYPESVFKQFIALVMGVGVFLLMGSILRNLHRVLALRRYIMVGASLLLIFNLLFATTKFGASNWVSIGGFSFQPSELVKVAFIWIGSASLSKLLDRKDNLKFMGFSAFCFICLALMGDFGTAIIFFVTFLVISYLRSGDFTKIILLVGVAFVGGLMVLKFKSYVAVRFASWLHVWEYADTTGFQQTRGLSAAASGGLVGVGAGNGWLSDIPASDTDLVFCLVTEEWGLIIAILAILSLMILSLYAIFSVWSGRSGFYTIAACAATSMYIFQMMLNVFGSVDIFPFTGVTFPFLSNGGSSMIASWAMLAFLKASDTRQNASFAISTSSKGLDWRGGLV